MKKYSLNRQERMKSRKEIEALFRTGKNFSLPPFRIFYTLAPATTGALQFGIGVSGKTFKNAVDRNRVKRLAREAWRLGKAELADAVTAKGIKLNVFFVFTGRELPSFSLVCDKTERAVERLKGLVIDENNAKAH